MEAKQRKAGFQPLNIVRIDIPHRKTHGWQVRISRQGERHTKFFSDSKHTTTDGGGGRGPAFRAAEIWRDQQLAKLPEPTQGFEVARRRRTRTGIPGLRYNRPGHGAPKGRIEVDWLDATGRRRVKSYSLSKYGLRKAVWNACMKLHAEQQQAKRITMVEGDPRTWFDTAFTQIEKLMLEEGDAVAAEA